MFYFHQGGDRRCYIASADWMTRNLEKRIELMIPIEEPALKRRLVSILDAFFQDNTQASRIMPDGTSQRLVRAKARKPSARRSISISKRARPPKPASTSAR